MGRIVFDRAFKDNAVKLSQQCENQSELVKESVIMRFLLNKRIKESEEYGAASFPSRGVERLTEEQCKINDLEKILKEKELALEILKKALAILHITSRHSAIQALLDCLLSSRLSLRQTIKICLLG